MISDTLTRDQLLFLEENYRLATEFSSDDSSISSEDLLKRTKMEHYIDRLTSILQSPNSLVTASQFSKRYAFLLTAPFFSSVTLFNRILDVRLGNCRIQPDSEYGLMRPALYLHHANTRETSTNREQELYIGLETIFRDHLTLVWERLSTLTSVPVQILWENTSVYFYWLYETSFHSHPGLASAELVSEDYQMILEAPAECFGLKENPLKKFKHTKQTLLKSEPPVRVRKTCCLYYEVNPERLFCKNCPRCLSGYTKD
ncbi:IucA/IucC family C-terminal-domain containing protein [Pseudalkalibacillus salsuginis]|uniref:IucA/IucC family C-terminal-domain containing protein n=1 Tax=Pseudalkalibacillus salsuginis TaxID=2910972 RepID=UPI001F387E69|nr:IucA/IucC family C-terminal-domain containing protein [Pseudalkalibacillus salsuginis]MCF6411137.1 (2Fe-2S)-binding protein [Pseudalkalibacillus salsuginis]